jgi:N-acetylglutamate synthase-like GNAT family acetyltransferase
MTQTSVRPACAADLPRVVDLLQSASLPTEGVAEHFADFLVAERDGTVIGAIGSEVYGTTALLRSAVVVASMQRKGIGTLLYDAILQHAHERKVTHLVLLTNSAESYFAAKGFKKIDQKNVTGPVRSSVEFSGACPSHAACMELML